jgi:tryptophan-rich sensory protein
MTGFGIFAIVWPFLSISLAIACVLAFHRYLDHREQRRHRAAE